MRLDLMVHAMVLSAIRLGRITLDNHGVQCRGHLHLSDAVSGILAALHAPIPAVSRQIFNISHHSVNASAVAEVVRGALGGAVLTLPEGGTPDLHHHRPSYRKAQELLGFQPEVGLQAGVRELIDALDPGVLGESAEVRTMRWIHEVLALACWRRGRRSSAPPGFSRPASAAQMQLVIAVELHSLICRCWATIVLSQAR
ncbi:MAG: hypothetical protein U5L01_00255 [Rheinheimera sp.]|nr:hypothetical protein [Rheinheimera sp.]